MLPELRQIEAELEPANRPASVLEIAAVVERLFEHYLRGDRTERSAENRLEDWYDDLDGLPLDVLQATARDWRRSTAKYAPTPGQFLDLSRKYADPRKAGLGMARLIIKALSEQPQQQEAA